MNTSQAHREPTALPGDDPRRRLVDQILKRFQYRPDALIEVLHVAQQAYGFLGRDLLGYIAARLDLPESQVFGVATFYHAFALRPRGEHSCIVCTGTACHVKGAAAILAALEAHYAIPAGRTTGDGRLTLGSARCLGICSLAPLLVIDGRVLGHETAAGVARRVEDALAGSGTEGRQ